MNQFTCETCGKCFAHPSTLKKHFKIHVKNKGLQFASREKNSELQERENTTKIKISDL